MNYKQEYRSLLLQQRLHYELTKANDMAAQLDGLSDEAFANHVSYMSDKLKDTKTPRSHDNMGQQPPRATDLPMPPPLVDDVETVRASIAEFMSTYHDNGEEE